jgi:hypothetical protein
LFGGTTVFAELLQRDTYATLSHSSTIVQPLSVKFPPTQECFKQGIASSATMVGRTAYDDERFAVSRAASRNTAHRHFEQLGFACSPHKRAVLLSKKPGHGSINDWVWVCDYHARPLPALGYSTTPAPLHESALVPIV